jgi:predicted DNA-binding transcriptional regulator AlpA
MEYEFILKYALADEHANAEQYLDALFEAGCDDATIGTGKTGAIALEFMREAASADDAVLSAIADVKKAIPDAELIEVSPDLVTPTEIATVIGCSRQNIQKIIANPKKRFPNPIHLSSAGGIWHLEPVLRWFMEDGISINKSLLEIAEISMTANLIHQSQKVNPNIQLKFLNVI